MIRVLLVAVIVLIQGCTSMYVYPESHYEPDIDSRLSHIVLGIERTPENFDYGWAGKPKAPFDLQTLIGALNEHQVFKQVAYLDQLETKPDLILKNYRHGKPNFRGLHGEHGGPLCVGFYYPISLLTLTALPIYCSSEEEVSFILSRDNDTSARYFGFARYDKDLLGIWAPVVATINSNWESTSTGDDSEKAEVELIKRYKTFVVKKFRMLEPSILEVLVNER